MGRPLRSRLQMDERRAQLIELGIGLFSERSYEEVSIEDIARAADVAKGLLYHYFGGKRSFYLACLEASAADLVEAVIPDASLPREVRAVAGLNAYLDWVESRADAYLALMHGGMGSDADVMAILDGTRAVIVENILEGLGLQTARPAFRIAARTWLGAVEAASLDYLAHRDVERHELVVLLAATINATVRTAAALDPEAQVDLPPPPDEVLLLMGQLPESG